VVKRGRDQPFDGSPQRRGTVGHDLDWLTMSAQCCGEEPSSRQQVAVGRDVHIDDLPVLIDGSVDVAPFAGNLASIHRFGGVITGSARGGGGVGVSRRCRCALVAVATVATVARVREARFVSCSGVAPRRQPPI
jgi:hypothetical protein